MGDQYTDDGILKLNKRKSKKGCVRFFVSGFGRFHGVDANPTTKILELLRAETKEGSRDSFPEKVAVELCEIMEVSAEGCTQSLDQQFISNDQPHWTSVYLHLGVCTSTYFRMEEVAVNCANFRCPDEKGYQPQDLPIDMTQLNTEYQRRCKLPLSDIVAKLELKGWEGKVQTSEDAGRFVCNYTYYQSLLRTDSYPNKLSLFIHVPHFDHIGEEDQLQFVKDAICTIADEILKSPTFDKNTLEKGKQESQNSCILI